MSSKYSSPLTFEVDENTYQKLEDIIRRSGGISLSQVVRVALDTFDFSGFRKEVPQTRQLSVRLEADLRAALEKVAVKEKASFGEILRTALGALSKKPLLEAVRKSKSANMPKKPSKKRAAKKAVKKAPAKKATKKVAKKATKKVAKKVAKKAVKKASAKKAAKKTAKKATKKAAKKVAKKAAKKVAKKAAKKVAKKAARKK